MPRERLRNERIVRSRFIALAVLRVQHLVIVAPQHLTFTPARQSLHRGVKVNNAQLRIDRQDTLGALFENSRQAILFLQQYSGL